VPRFIFHTNDPDQSPALPRQFKSISEAKCEAVRFAGQLLCDAADHFWNTADFELTVADEKGLILFSMRLVGIEAPAIRKEAPFTASSL
jgi:hypothetical protein